MKVLLVNPIIRAWHKPTYPPIGIGYLAEVLRMNGIDVEILDINARRYTDEQIVEELKKRTYDVVGTGGVLTLFREIKKLTKMMKETKSKIPIIVGGSVGDTLPELVLKKTNADFTIIGEAEYSFLELCKRIDEDGKDFSDIKGLAYLKDGEVHLTKKRKGIMNLDEIPFPAYDLMDMDIYLANQFGNTSRFKRSLSISTTRGCVYNCTFCTKSFRQYPYRMRGIDNVIAEIKYLKRRYDIDFIAFSDDLWVLTKKRTFEFCKRLNEEKLGIKWLCNARVDTITDEQLKEMKNAGCIAVSYGVESGSQKMLDVMDKKVKVEDNKKAIELTFKNGLWPIVNFIIGMQGENHQTIQETVDFCKQVGLPGTFFYVNPYPGSRLWEQVKDQVLDKYDIEDYMNEINDITDFILNLSDLSDEELIKAKVAAEKQMRKNFYRNPLFVARRLIAYCQYTGGIRSIFSVLKRKLYLSKTPKLKILKAKSLRVSSSSEV